jgi:ABC-type transport system involved in multi-copper enzyme maturation permease subunit
MFFATLYLEREPMQWAELPGAALGWLQSAGLVAALAIFLVFAVRSSFRFDLLFTGIGGAKPSKSLVRLGTIATLLAWAGYAALLLLFIGSALGVPAAQDWLPGVNPLMPTVGDLVFAFAGALAIAVVVFPVIRSLAFDVRVARIWAVARLSIKESIRNRAVAIFAVLPILFLFLDWFIPPRPEDQIRNYVLIIYWAMFALFLLTAAVLGAYSLPSEIKSLTIHTVVTKPITKFEIVLGRFLGHGLLLSVSLFGLGLLSLLFISRGLTEEAKNESFVARVPVYGNLGFLNTKGESVGREWDYRRYIAGQNMSGTGKRQYAVWLFDDLSEIEPLENGNVKLQFTFDIFRLTKGDENKGVFCTFKFTDGMTDSATAEAKVELRRQEKDKRLAAARNNAGPKTDFAELGAKIDAELLKEFPVFERAGVEVTDYHTQTIEVPMALIEKLRQLDQSRAPNAEGLKPPAMVVYVSIDPDRGSAAQMLGVARRDFFVLAAENSFYVNFLKGLVGIWLLTLVVLGVAVCSSTYLSFVVSLLVTVFLLLSGYFRPAIAQLATNQSVGGGPAESFTRLVTRSNAVTPLDESPSTSVIQGIDAGFRWQMRLILAAIPDVGRYDLRPYVANGYDISPSKILLADNVLPTVAYLLPWFVLAFYLINYREIANPM